MASEVVVDRGQTPLPLFADVGAVLAWVSAKGIQVAYASRTWSVRASSG